MKTAQSIAAALALAHVGANVALIGPPPPHVSTPLLFQMSLLQSAYLMDELFQLPFALWHLA